MYILVTYFVTGSSSKESDLPAILKGIFIGISAAAAGINFAIQTQILGNPERYRQCRNIDDALKVYGRYFYISLALCQLPALMGLVQVFMSMRMSDWAPFIVFIIFMHATSIPRAGRLETIAQAHALSSSQVAADDGMPSG